MFFLMQKMLEHAMRLGKCRHRPGRFLGKLLSVFPVWYSSRMEKKLMDGTWNPAEKWRKKGQKKRRRKNRR